MNTFSHSRTAHLPVQVRELPSAALSALQVDRGILEKGPGNPGFDDYVHELIDELIGTCRELYTPAAGYRIVNNVRFLNESNSLLAGDQVFTTGKLVTSFLKNSSHIAVFAGTCGEKIEEYSGRLQSQGKILESYIVSKIGSEYAEQIAELVHRQIEQAAGEAGLSVTNRYSPGYCNWPVSDQQKLFKLFGNNTFGIQLTSSSFMKPVKSVSGIVGIGKEVKKLGYICNVCPENECMHRDMEKL